MGIHDGHRQRLRERFAQQGADGFQDHELLEYLLTFALPRVNTNPIAHRLLDAFGSFSGVLDAPAEELVKIEGMGPNAAALIQALPGMARRYYTGLQTEEILNSTERCGAYFLPRFIGRSVETVFLACTDVKCKVLSCTLLCEGSVNSTAVSARLVVQTALRANAVGVILAHNHPGGIALPSDADLHTTQRLAEALGAVGVRLLDHIIVADTDFVSLADSNMVPRCVP